MRNKIVKRILKLPVIMALIISIIGISIFTVIHTVEVMAETTYETYKKALRAKGFPETYLDALATLQVAHPNWVFVKYDTGISYTDMLNLACRKDYCVVPNVTTWKQGKSYPTLLSWKASSTLGKVNGVDVFEATYNFIDSTYIVHEENGNNDWVQASREYIAYMMDPRNWLNESSIFQFESLSYNSTTSDKSVLDAIQAGSFMATSKVDGTQTYTSVFQTAGAANNISPSFLCARVRQEKGTTGDYLGNGVWVKKSGSTYSVSTVNNGGTKVYNYYNISATGTEGGVSSNGSVASGSRIYNGAVEAYKSGWTSQYDALVKGAAKIATNYIKGGNDTRYLQKFDAVGTSYGTVCYQTNVLAPLNEAYSTYTAYKSSGMLSKSCVFSIPVYTGIDNVATNSEPTGNSNPNFKLAPSDADIKKFCESNSSYAYSSYSKYAKTGIKVVGNNTDGTTKNLSLNVAYSMNTTSYSISVPYEIESVNVSAIAAYSGSTITISGTSGIGSVTGKVALTEGKNNTINIVCKAENGKSKTYTLVIYRDYATYSYDISNYQVNGSKINNFVLGEKVSAILDKIKVVNCSAKVLNSKSQVKSGDSVIATGDYLAVYNGAGTLIKKYQVIIYGDINGDGKTDLGDFLKVKQHLITSTKLTGAALEAADMRDNGTIDLGDFLEIKKCLIKKTTITQKH